MSCYMKKFKKNAINEKLDYYKNEAVSSSLPLSSP